jgi:GxxExxY protein
VNDPCGEHLIRPVHGSFAPFSFFSPIITWITPDQGLAHCIFRLASAVGLSGRGFLSQIAGMKNPAFQLADIVRETSYAIHRYFGPGHLEKVYCNALIHRLHKQGLDVECQKRFSVFDEDGMMVGDYHADLVVNDLLIVEVKAAKALNDQHYAQLLGYLRSARMEHGVLVNFGAATFEIRKLAMSEGRRRVMD